MLSSVFCFSNILPDEFSTHNASVPYIFPMRFFSSWGWACDRNLWLEFRRTEPDTYRPFSLFKQLPEIGWVQRALLLKAWNSSFRRILSGEQNTWALLFTLFLVQTKTRIYYPNRNLIHHLAHKDSVNVKSNPRWYQRVVIESIQIDPNYFDELQIRENYSNEQHKFWATNVFGASGSSPT
jgi:hypothetical protein